MQPMSTSSRARMIHGQAAQRWRAWHGAEPAAWASYQTLTEQLPALLRESGLWPTLAWLRQWSTDGNAAQQLAGPALVADWLGVLYASDCTPQALPTLKPSALLARLDPDDPGPLGRLAHRLVVQDAQQLRRSVAALTLSPPDQAPAPVAAHQAQRMVALLPILEEQGKLWAPPWVGQPWVEHPGLLWRFGMNPLGRFDAKTTWKTDHVARVLRCNPMGPGRGHGQAYRLAYARWRAWVQADATHRVWAQVQTRSRLMLGLGGASLLETQVLLHPVHGLPYIPGSTLKGLLRAWLTRRAGTLAGQDEQAAAYWQDVLLPRLFGVIRKEEEVLEEGEEPSQAGSLVIHDAWWIPADKTPLAREVETPHHSEYHSGVRERPSGFESPIPVAQLAVKDRGQFLLCVQTPGEPDSGWAQQALNWLCEALHDPVEGGLGAKAYAAGYGRLERV